MGVLQRFETKIEQFVSEQRALLVGQTLVQGDGVDVLGGGRKPEQDVVCYGADAVEAVERRDVGCDDSADVEVGRAGETAALEEGRGQERRGGSGTCSTPLAMATA